MSRMDVYEAMPKAMRAYLSNYGWHFSKKMCEFAAEHMKDKSGEKITPYDKEKIDSLLKQYGIELKNNKGYDAVYVCNMAMADYYGSSIPNQQYLAMFVKDYIDDKDAPEGKAFGRFYADTIGLDIPIMWEDMM